MEVGGILVLKSIGSAAQTCSNKLCRSLQKQHHLFLSMETTALLFVEVGLCTLEQFQMRRSGKFSDSLILNAF